MTDDGLRSLALAGGGTLQYLIDEGAAAGSDLVVYHHGTPAAGPLADDMVSAARANGLRLVELVRPGYGASTRQPGRLVRDVVPLVSALADALGHERFGTIGWSGGGPHALATVALLPERCAGAICLAGVAPFEADGLNFLVGMGEDNWHEFGAALAGDFFLDQYLSEAAGELVGVQADAVIAALDSLLPDADRRVLDGGMAEQLAAELRWSVAAGPGGWFDDDMAFVRPWGFDLAAITRPVAVWQGADDLMVPISHGRWLSAAIPGATSHLLPDEGHLSIGRQLEVAFRGLRDQWAN